MRWATLFLYFQTITQEIKMTIDKTNGESGNSSQTGTIMNWGAKYDNIEIYIAGPQLEELRDTFDDFGENPEIVGLFRKELFGDDGLYDGDGCDRLDIRDNYMWAALDGTSDEYFKEILEDCIACAQENPDLSYMVVGGQVMIPSEDKDEEDDETQRYDVVFLRGFDAANNPLKHNHGRFYKDFVVRGI